MAFTRKHRLSAAPRGNSRGNAIPPASQHIISVSPAQAYSGGAVPCALCAVSWQVCGLFGFRLRKRIQIMPNILAMLGLVEGRYIGHPEGRRWSLLTPEPQVLRAVAAEIRSMKPRMPHARRVCVGARQALPDFKDDAPADDQGARAASEVAMWKVAITEHLAHEEQVRKAAGRIRQQMQSREHRIANKHYACAFERALSTGSGLALKRFVIQAPPKALLPHEVRFHIEEDPIAGTRRVCVRDTRDNSTRFELQRSFLDGRLFRPALFTHIESGPIGLPYHIWLFTQAKIRGAVVTDFIHAMQNMTKRALRKTGCWWVCAETLIAYNYSHGPFNSQSFFNVVRECVTRYLDSVDWTCPFFAHFYDALTLDSGARPAHFGTAEHMREVFAGLRNRAPMMTKGRRVRLGRWWSWHDRQGEIMENHGFHLFALCLVGVRRGWWPSVYDTPTERTSARPPSVGEKPDEADVPEGEPARPAAGADVAEDRRLGSPARPRWVLGTRGLEPAVPQRPWAPYTESGEPGLAAQNSDWPGARVGVV